jgi:hypothetical protein
VVADERQVGLAVPLDHPASLGDQGAVEPSAPLDGMAGQLDEDPSGAGIDLRTSTPTRDEVRSAVDRVLGEPAFRRNARRIGADFARHDGPREAAELLENLASTGAPVLREGGAERA